MDSVAAYDEAEGKMKRMKGKKTNSLFPIPGQEKSND